MSVVLGINAYHAGSSTAVVVDGVPVAAIADERLNRKKYRAKFRALAIRKRLRMARLQLSDIDAPRDPVANREEADCHLRTKMNAWAPAASSCPAPTASCGAAAA